MAKFNIGDEVIGNISNKYGITKTGTRWFVTSDEHGNGFIYVSCTNNMEVNAAVGDFFVEASQFDLYREAPRPETRENKTKAFVLKARVPYAS